MTYFNSTEQSLMARIGFLVAMVGESELHSEPCPLLDSQLNRLAVLTEELHVAISDVREALDERKD